MDEKEIFDEMHIMASMNHVESVIRIYGYFMDTMDGLIPRKICRQPPLLPVIVMEHMSGGPLFGRLNYQENVSEKYLASVFKAIVTSVSHLHAESFVHRDLKLENIMYVDSSEKSPVRIIDLGMSVKLATNGVYIDKLYLVGTPGCYAPESIVSQEYSVKTDIWQLGCILYMLLSGLTPFHRDKVEQITHRGYYKMSGKGWSDISDSAKDLVHKILKRKAPDRLSIEQILQHPWMKEAADSAMDTDYKTRIKRLALRDKMKKLFCENHLSVGNAERQQNLIENVPLLKANALSVKNHSMKPYKRTNSMANDVGDDTKEGNDSPEIAKQMSDFNGKLKKLKTMVVRRMSTDFDSNADTGKAQDKEIDYPAFVSMLNHCHLEELCTPAVFNIFDIGNTGTVDPKEFLMTMIAFRPVMESGEATVPSGGGTGQQSEGDCSILSNCSNNSSSDDSDARLFFEMFDIKETGFIDMDELKLAVKFLLFMGTDSPQDLPNVEEMFNTIDLAQNGRIDFDEFKIFYKQLLSSQNSLTIRIA
jgi:serine/threonine protein kinase